MPAKAFSAIWILRRKALASIISLIELFTRLGNIILFPIFKADIIQKNKDGESCIRVA